MRLERSADSEATSNESMSVPARNTARHITRDGKKTKQDAEKEHKARHNTSTKETRTQAWSTSTCRQQSTTTCSQHNIIVTHHGRSNPAHYFSNIAKSLQQTPSRQHIAHREFDYRSGLTHATGVATRRLRAVGAGIRCSGYLPG
eukprot:2338361-Rhodomonas_salina.1